MFFHVMIFSFMCLMLMKCWELVELSVTFLAVVLNYKFKMLSICFLSLELLPEGFFPICAYILWITLQVSVVFSTYFPFLADFQVPLNRLFLCYSTFNFEFGFMQTFALSIYFSI